MPKPKTTKLQALLEQLEAARGNFAAAFEHITEQLDFSPVEDALTAWRQAAEAFATAARTVHDEASAYYEARSETWQDSEKGQAFVQWMDELESLADFDGEPTDTVRIALDLSGEVPVAELEGDPSEVLPDVPDIPELEE